ncbi:hypothetical protein E2I00_016319, partial [Balaenoptera physalus]
MTAECFENKYGYTHLSAGELLRDERKNPDSQYGELIEKYIKDGKIVPVEITISLLRREMDQTMAANAQKNKFLIDGFPRNQDNLQGWNKTMDGKADVSFVLFFDCNNEICIERCLERGKSSGRSDDNRESLEKRIQTYLQSTKPIIDLYEEMGKVKKIDASKSVDEVFDEVTKHRNCESRKLANSQVPNLVEKVVWKSDADMKRMFEYLVPDITK